MELIKVYTTTCPQCKALDMVLDKIKDKYPSITFKNLNAEEDEQFVTDNKIRNVPTLLLYKDKDIVWRNVGMISQSKLENKLQEYV